jgi:hypothetical protein
MRFKADIGDEDRGLFKQVALSQATDGSGERDLLAAPPIAPHPAHATISPLDGRPVAAPAITWLTSGVGSRAEMARTAQIRRE